MRFTVSQSHIYLSSECEAEKLQIKDALSQLQRYKIAHQHWGGDSLHIYTKSHDQFEDEKKSRE